MDDKEIIRISNRLEYDIKQNSYISTRNTKYDDIELESFRIKLSKPIIDEIDKVLAKHYGFTEEELDFIINYDIKYRMGDELNDSEYYIPNRYWEHCVTAKAKDRLLSLPPNRYALRTAHTRLGHGDQPTGGGGRGQWVSFTDGERGTEDPASRQVWHHCCLGQRHVSSSTSNL